MLLYRIPKKMIFISVRSGIRKVNPRPDCIKNSQKRTIFEKRRDAVLGNFPTSEVQYAISHHQPRRVHELQYVLEYLS
jgi:hypothetical protein